MTISGAMQPHAARLFGATTSPVRFDDQEAAKAAILAA
jgi:hypothetical protein